jgi:hypothetical protein
MTMIGCAIVFLILCVLLVGVYVYLYHYKKRKILAISIAVIVMSILLLSIIFVLPFPHRAEIIEENAVNMHVEKINNQHYAVCEDGTKYKLKAINTSVTSGYNSYRNDHKYKDVKVNVTYRYNYKIWWIIPAHYITYSTDIYFDNDFFNNLYGCGLDFNKWNER